jgi:ribonucleoside-diphosphate reductase alpha subunit
MDSENMYFLKTNLYKSDRIEKQLCEAIRKTNWNAFPDFFTCIDALQKNKNESGIEYPLLDDSFFKFLKSNKSYIEEMIKRVEKQTDPFEMTYFGLETMKSKYLLKTHDGIHENIDHLWLRISLFIHQDSMDRAEEMFCQLRQGLYVHATPTLFNAGCRHHQMASCFRKGTKILTSEGYEPIESIKLGTLVWTHEKVWKPVIQKHENLRNNRKIYRLGFPGTLPIFVTEDHPLRVFNLSKGIYEWNTVKQCTKSTLFMNPQEKPLYSEYTCFLSAICYTGINDLFDDICEISIYRDSKFFVRMKDVIEKEFEVVEFTDQEKIRKYILKKQQECKSKIFSLETLQQNFDIVSFSRFVKGLLQIYNSNRPNSNTIRILQEDYMILKILAKRYHLKIDEISAVSHYMTIKICNPNILITDYSPFVKLCSKIQFPCFDRFVYTLGVADNHSYTVNGTLVAKNCFLLGNEDSIDGIYDTLKHCAKISKFSGGIGLHCHTIRSSGSYIWGTNGKSNGIVPMLKVFNNTARYVDQGGGKRSGSIAIYLETWHADIQDFLSLKKNIGSEETRARDLFYALWVSDYFMECVELDKPWFLFDPSKAKNLNIKYGSDFKELYQYYVGKKLYEKQIRARDLWTEICRSQIETGTPYFMYKDQCNKLSNQKNLGTIQSSNLCCEIMQYSTEKEYAVCNLASISLPKCLKPNSNLVGIKNLDIITKEGCTFCDLAKYFLRKNKIDYKEHDQFYEKLEKGKSFPQIFINDSFIGGFKELWETYLRPEFDFEILKTLTQTLVYNLNKVIDKNDYPLEECRISNERHRPMGIGCQGLADVFMQLLEPYDSEYARKLNRDIFETMYFSAITCSVSLAKEHGAYESFQGSPLQKGQFHFEMGKKYPYDLRHDWDSLRKDVQTYGCRNSLFIALMPTASTSQLLGQTECFEPLTSNFYVRRTNIGEFLVINRILQNLLIGMNMWNDNMHEQFLFHKGSIQSIKQIPSFIKDIFRTVWEIPTKSMIQMSAERQFFIDQSQSFNIYLTNPSVELLTKIHFYGWKQGLKTGSYYIRTRSLTKTQNFFVDAAREKELQECENCSA